MSRYNLQAISVNALCAAFVFTVTSTALAVAPNPLQSAYWRFEEGTPRS